MLGLLISGEVRVYYLLGINYNNQLLENHMNPFRSIIFPYSYNKDFNVYSTFILILRDYSNS